MAEPTRIRGMNVERTVEQILNAMEDDDEEICRETENSDSSFSDEDYQIYTPPSLGSHYSDTEAVIPCLTDSESESENEDEDSFNTLPTTSPRFICNICFFVYTFRLKYSNRKRWNCLEFVFVSAG